MSAKNFPTLEMDIYAEVRSFSFYESSGSIYVTVRVIEKRLKKADHPSKKKFEEVEIGETITLRTDRETIIANKCVDLPTLVNKLLLNRLLIFDINDWEAPSKGVKISNPKFLIANVSKCVTLMEN